jgi:tRNA (guanine-N7-)-methyltransferase
MTKRHESRRVNSAQKTVHPRLETVVDVHLAEPSRDPVHPPTVEAFEALGALGVTGREKLVLDSGCGTGDSTRQLAGMLPDCLVIGVDKSLARLSRTGARSYPHREGNALWLRAELASFWRLARADGWRLHRHYLLYPNPWPKPGQLRRRWHAHPVFPDLLGLGGRLEMRCNWDIYALEFALAAGRVLGREVCPGSVEESGLVSPFERKYRASGHPLYSVVVSDDSNGVK